jgi:hypothetical protein
MTSEIIVLMAAVSAGVVLSLTADELTVPSIDSAAFPVASAVA